jgi:4-aminobutyrate--pyruvate transaminase
MMETALAADHNFYSSTLIHQQTSLEAIRRDGAIRIVGGDGVMVWDDAGRRYIEAMAGLWSASLGFSERRLAAAAQAQMLQLPFYHTFFGKEHGPAALLADRLKAMAPVPIGGVLFQSSGSEANDAAIKMAWHYWAQRGQPEKRKIIGRVRGYHGNTVATVSLSGQPHMYAGFNLPLPGFIHTDNPNYYRFARDGESELEFSARMAANLEALIIAEGPETIASMHFEPVQGGGGAITPPEGYFAAMQAVLRRHDILIVADEVVCGFGRTGTMWGSTTYGITPDMICCAKALTAAYQPLSALLVSQPIYDALIDGSRTNGSFGHGYTYGGHPVACAVALETLDIYDEIDICGHVTAVSKVFLAELDACRASPIVGDVRGIGLIAGVELMRDGSARTAFPPGIAGPEVEKACLQNGLIVRAIGDRIAFSPPLIITADEVRDMVARFRRALADAEPRIEARLAVL